MSRRYSIALSTGKKSREWVVKKLLRKSLIQNRFGVDQGHMIYMPVGLLRGTEISMHTAPSGDFHEIFMSQQ